MMALLNNKGWILACLLLTGILVRAQEPAGKPVTIHLTQTRYADFLKQLEKQSGFRIYYDTAELDTARIDINVDQAPLTKVLDQAFSGTEMSYSIDRHRHVFVAKGEAIRTDLPADYFERHSDKEAVAVGDSVRDYLAEVGQPQVATLENKLYVIGDKGSPTPNRVANVAGYARDAKTGEPIVGASIYVENPRIGVASDQYGYFSISLPKGRHILNIQSIGMRDTRRLLMVYGDGKLNIDLQTQIITLKKVIVSAEKASNVRRTEMGVQKLDIKTIKQVPVVFGEADVLRVITTLPGVKTVGEASTGLNVRGGSTDQNLILFNDATIYNTAHFFGMFSAFNPEVVKDVELYKSSIPAKFGGRLSSVVDISSREGNKKDFAGSAGIGLLTSRLNLEGPLVKDKTSFIIGGRTTYANWLLNALPEQYKHSRASFYDANLNISHQMGKKDNLYLTGYISQDHFNLNNDTTYGYGNRNIGLKWKHIYNNRLFHLISTGYDRYQYSIRSQDNPVNAYNLGFDINQLYFRTHFNYFIGSSHTLEFGVSTLKYMLHPGQYTPNGKGSLVQGDTLAKEQALESGAYLSDRYTISNSISLEAGVRYSLYNYLGPATVNTYAPGQPITLDNQTGSASYPSGKFIKTYGGPEFRLSSRVVLTDNMSIKAGYNTQRQYIHMLSNTTAIAPTDIWKLSDPNIRPQYGDQVSLGLYRNFKNNTIETSLEVYYKHIKDYLDYKSGAVLVMNHHIETDVLETKGKAYGVELLIKKLTGKFNGWLSYTYSRILLRQDDPNAGELVNGGQFYPANYDKPHDVTLVSNYRITHRVSWSFNATYSTGRPITLPIGVFMYAGSLRTLYADRNAYRIPDYFRADISLNVLGNHKVYQKFHNSWTFGVYNLTGRHNPYSVYYTSENGAVNGYKLSVFGSAIPYVNYNIAF
ncbi:MAG TPA: carboxypeptidase-like regulatory domain-containing protein [Puia sp.]|uniref:TonB-dependent receptor n=1 Tax=Puia sp. TaxID=2045100 RepID=UPI002CE8F974|nr:carboxypeptidase-like regulatory domain-containing protein [Puia sp.]HVU96538.1 carboxypeptidase-like regulatory domain-containing protein [Puia sp.]